MSAGSIAQVTGSGQGLPGTSWALNDFGSVATDVDSILSASSGVYTPQEQGYYLIIAESKFNSTHGNRLDIEQKIQKNSTDYAGAVGSDYSRNTANDMSWQRSSMVAYFNGSTDTFRIMDRRDTGAGTPAGAYTWTRIKVVQLSAGDSDSLAYGHYGTPTSAAYAAAGAPDASSVVDGWDVITENDTDSIELQVGGTDITLKRTDRPYLVLYGFPTDATGVGRTFRLSDLTFGGTRINHSFGHAYQRDGANQYAVPEGMALIAPSSSDDLNARIWLYEDNKATHWGTCNAEGWTLSSAAGRAGIMVVELPADTDFAIFDDATANQTWSGSATTDLNFAATESDAGTNFTKDSSTAVSVDAAANVMAYAAYLIERTASSGTRGSNAARWEVEGTDKTTETEFGQYIRGEQSADDEKNTALGVTHIFAASAGDTLNLEKFDPGTDDGNNDVTSMGGAFFIDLDTLVVSSTTDYDETGRTVAVAATVTATDGGDFIEPTRTVAVTATVTATDVTPGNYQTIVIEQKASAVADSTTSISLASPLTGIHTDEIVIAVVFSGYTGSITAPNHYVEMYANDSTDGAMAIFYRVQPDETEDPEFTFDGSEEHGLTVYVVSGLANPGDDIDPTDKDSSWIASGSYDTTQPGTTGTLSQADELLIAAASGWGGDTTMGWDSGFTEDADLHNGSDLNYGAAHKIVSSTAAVFVTCTFGENQTDPKSIIGTFKAAEIPTLPDNIRQMRAMKLPSSVDNDMEITLPLTPLEDNGLVAVYLGGGNWSADATISGTGWTELWDRSGSDPPYSTLAAYYKVAGSSEPAAINVIPPQSDAGVAYVIELEDIDDTDFLEDSDDENDTTTGNSMTSGTVTVASTAVVLSFMHQWNTPNDQSMSPPAGWEKLFDMFADSGGGIREMQTAAAVDHWDDESNTITWSWTDNSDYGGGTIATLAFNTVATSTDYDETGRTVAVIATVAATDDHNHAYTENVTVAIVSSTEAGDLLTRGELGRVVAITSTVTATDQIPYDESGKQISIVATVTGTDAWGTTDDVAVTVTSTVTATDDRTLTDEDVAVAVVATVTATDDFTGVVLNEDVSVAIVSTVSASDTTDLTDSVSVNVLATVTADDGRNMTEAGTVNIAASVTATAIQHSVEDLLVAVTSIVTGTDDHNHAYTETLTVNVTSSVAATDDRTLTDEDVTVAITSTVTGTGTADYLDAATVAITAMVTGTDQLTTPGAYEEFRSVAISSTVTGTDAAEFTESAEVPIVATVTATDAWATSEAGIVTVTSSVAVTDQLEAVESGSVAVVAAVSVTDDLSSVEAVTVAITAAALATDVHSSVFSENVTVAIVAAVTATDTAAWLETFPTFKDDWTGTASDPWDSDKWPYTTGLAILSSGWGRLATGSNPFSWTSSRASTYGNPSADHGNAELLFKVFWNTTDGISAYSSFNLRHVDNDWGINFNTHKPDEGMMVWVNSSTFGVAIRRAGSDLVTDTTTFSRSTWTDYWVRARAVGSTIEAKIWEDGDDEPADWMVSALDIAAPSDGHLSLAIGSYKTAKYMFVDDLVLTLPGTQPTIAITAGVAATDVYTPPDTYVENVAVSISATVAATDDLHILPIYEDVTVNIVATVVGTDSAGATETAVVAITASVIATDEYLQHETLLVAITSSISSTDLFAMVDPVSIEIVSAVVATDTCALLDALVVPIQSTVGSWDNWYMLLEPGTGTGSLEGRDAGLGQAEDEGPAGILVGVGQAGQTTDNLSPGATSTQGSPGVTSDSQGLGRTET